MGDEHPAGRPRVVPGGDDRLSALPDALLHSIMASLPTRQAVQTCVLARRWRHLWRSVPSIDVDSDEFTFVAGTDATSEVSFVPSRERWEKLEAFAANLLRLHRVPVLDRFRLRVNLAKSSEASRSHEYHTCLALVVGDVVERIGTWTRLGAGYDPAVLEVSLGFLPDHRHGVVLPRPPAGSVSRRLKSLRLRGVKLDKGFAKHLQLGCPLLEDLELKRCVWGVPALVSGTVKNLTLDRCVDNLRRQQRSVTAPSLASLRLVCAPDQDGILFSAVDSLVTATIEYRSFDDSFDKIPCELLACLANNVRTLKLSRFRKPESPFVNGTHGSFPKFHKLATLVLDRCDMSRNFNILLSFLHNAPNLETVSLQQCEFSGNSMGKRKADVTRKLIEVKYREDRINELLDRLSNIGWKLPESTVFVTRT